MTSSIRANDARLLATAGDLLMGLDRASPRPLQPIGEALDLMETAFASVQNYGNGKEIRQLRIGVLRLRNVRQAFDRDARVSGDDYRLLAATAREIADIGTSIQQRNRAVAVVAMNRSALGLRFDGADVRELGRTRLLDQGTRVVVASEEHQWSDAEHLRERMPRAVPRGAPFVTWRGPVVVFTKSWIADVALDRSGLTWTRGTAAGEGRVGYQPGMSRLGAGGPYQPLLMDQLLVGFDRRVLDAVHDRGEPIAGAIAQLGRRMGRMSAPLGEKGRLMVSPGNPLSWLWLVPAHVMGTTHMVPTEANFPWKTDHVAMTAQQRTAHQREIDQINDQAAVLQREGKSLDAHVIMRQSRLLEDLDRSMTPQQKRDAAMRERGETPPTLAQRRAAMQTEIDRRCMPLRKQIADERSLIESMGPSGKSGGALSGQARESRQRIAELDAKILKITEDEQKKARALMRGG